LYQTTPQNITQHVAAIYEEGELDEEATCKPFLQVRQEGSRKVRRNLKFYSLPVIIAVGYWVRSHRGTQRFFATVQNKMHWAVHGQTAAEVVAARADASQPNMGLTSWVGERPRKADAAIAKNYLREEELAALNRIVMAYIEFAELQALDRKPMYMADWIRKLDDFLKLSEREILSLRRGPLRRSARRSQGRGLLALESFGEQFVTKVLGRQLGLSQ